MRVLLYEWCCSGGLAGGDMSLATEGRMMLEALAADAAKAPTIEMAVLVDAAMSLTLPSQARTMTVPRGEDVDTLVAAAREVDWTIIVAPESRGILLDRVRRVRAAGARVLAPHDRVIEVCSDKQATVDTLAARGVPVPAGRSLEPRESIPNGFHMPAIRKARAGCGCDDLQAIISRQAAPAAVPTRLESFVEGTPVGVSLLAGPAGHVALPSMRQRFEDGDRPRYVGSEPLADDEAAARAIALASRVARAVDADCGWIGVDLILGPRADGRDDRVLEVNPRMTTSIVGLAPLYATSLIAAMIDLAEGRPPALVKLAAATIGAGSFSIAPD